MGFVTYEQAKKLLRPTMCEPLYGIAAKASNQKASRKPSLVKETELERRIRNKNRTRGRLII